MQPKKSEQAENKGFAHVGTWAHVWGFDHRRTVLGPAACSLKTHLKRDSKF